MANTKELEIVVRARGMAEEALKRLQAALKKLGKSLEGVEADAKKATGGISRLQSALHGLKGAWGIAHSGASKLKGALHSLVNPFGIVTGLIRGLAIHLGVIFGVGGIAAIGY